MRLIKPLLLLAIPNVAALSQAANAQIRPLPVIKWQEAADHS
jgi:hypothetical protein